MSAQATKLRLLPPSSLIYVIFGNSRLFVYWRLLGLKLIFDASLYSNAKAHPGTSAEWRLHCRRKPLYMAHFGSYTAVEPSSAELHHHSCNLIVLLTCLLACLSLIEIFSAASQVVHINSTAISKRSQLLMLILASGIFKWDFQGTSSSYSPPLTVYQERGLHRPRGILLPATVRLHLLQSDAPCSTQPPLMIDLQFLRC